jgi:hypothetical protein
MSAISGRLTNGLLSRVSQTITQVDSVEVQAGPSSTVEIVVPPSPPPKPQLHDMDLERVRIGLYRNRYLTLRVAC